MPKFKRCFLYFFATQALFFVVLLVRNRDLNSYYVLLQKDELLDNETAFSNISLFQHLFLKFGFDLNADNSSDNFANQHSDWVNLATTPRDIYDIDDVIELNMTDIYDWGNCTEEFKIRYWHHCERLTEKLQQRRNVDESTSTHSYLCPCLPPTLVGQTTNPGITKFVNWGDLEAAHPEVRMGGRWTPIDCRPRQRIALIIPFRDRLSHLKKLLEALHPLLQRQRLDYHIFVVEQDNLSTVFNKGMIMNSGFLEIYRGHPTILQNSTSNIANSTESSQNTISQQFSTAGPELDPGLTNPWGPFDCYIFHDVDMLPENDYNMYTCTKGARHVGAWVDKFQYNLLYVRIFGGVTAFTAKQFIKVNGFSNEFYGWGGEDDDMRNRLDAQNISMVRFPRCVAKYKMIRHTVDKGNPYNKKSGIAWKARNDVYRINGLTNIKYTLLRWEERPLYTWLLVSVPPPQTSKRRR